MREQEEREIQIRINGKLVAVPVGSTVAVAMTIANAPCRVSVGREERGPLCGMGICFECQTIIDGIRGRLACQTLCRADMDVKTDG